MVFVSSGRTVDGKDWSINGRCIAAAVVTAGAKMSSDTAVVDAGMATPVLSLDMMGAAVTDAAAAAAAFYYLKAYGKN